MDKQSLTEAVQALGAEDKAQLDALLTEGLPIWTPLEGPQSEAYASPADILFYGGAAGGGKTDLVIGLSLVEHFNSIIFRREGTQLQGIYDRMGKILGSRDGFNSKDRVWRLPNRQIEFGAVAHAGDEEKYQGRPHDLLVFDEITHFSEYAFRFLQGWLRSEVEGVRQRVVCTGNPPTTAEGEWIKIFFGPWLDDSHPNPAKDGELRWYASLDGKDVERDNGESFWYEGELIEPTSRTFIPSRVTDNPYLMSTGYKRRLQALPEPLRSQMLYGNFKSGGIDDPWQVIPSSWVQDAMNRWVKPNILPPMDCLGVDVACGGKDKTVIVPRYGNFFGELQEHAGADTPNGALTASLVVACRTDNAPVHIDVVGWGKDSHTHLVENGIHTVAINGANRTDEKTKVSGHDRNGQLDFVNTRAMLYWRLREELNPANNNGVMLPPDPQLKAELCAHRWELRSNGVFVLSKDKVKAILGRSPDKSDAVAYANIKTVKITEDFGRVHQMDGDWSVF
jgi:hypothetical protein